MLSKSITYTDYNGVSRTETFLFNLTKAELMEMEMGIAGGLAERIQQVINSNNGGEIIRIFKELILKAYGEKSPDGKMFIKVDEHGNSLGNKFAQTEAYSELFMELATSAEAAAAFVRGITPSDIEIDEASLPEELKTPEMVEAIKSIQKETPSETQTETKELPSAESNENK